jgi:hypothetical protein
MAAALLVLIFIAAIWTFVRNRPTAATRQREEEQQVRLPKAA